MCVFVCLLVRLLFLAFPSLFAKKGVTIFLQYEEFFSACNVAFAFNQIHITEACCQKLAVERKVFIFKAKAVILSKKIGDKSTGLFHSYLR